MSTHPLTSVRPRRRLRNLVVDWRFQFKYTGILVGTMLGLFAVLGSALYEAANIAAAQAHDAADLANIAEDQAEHAFRETQASSRILRMNQLAEADMDPAVVHGIESELDQVDAHAHANVLRIHLQRETVRAQRTLIDRAHHRLLTLLIVSALSLLCLLGALGVVITHRLVGPVFHLKRMFHEVGDGRLDIHDSLRRHDEFVDLFDAFISMVSRLRERHAKEITEFDAALDQALRLGAQEASVAPLRAALSRMRTPPDAPTPSKVS